MSHTSNVPSTRSDDRVFVLEQIDDQAPRNVMGNVDKRLYTGGNRLHAKKDHETCLWFFKLDEGAVPERLKCKFTGFKDAKKYAEEYYKTRNLKITEVLD